MRKPTILVVDDENELLNFFQKHLTASGFDVRTAGTGTDALRVAHESGPDLVILDLMLPGMDGVEVCQRLREWSAVPIIVVSAKSQDRDKVQVLDMGADDYLVKPFSTVELLARIRAVLRRNLANSAAPIPSPSVFEAGHLRVDFARQRVTMDEKSVRLTPTEYSVLRQLVVNAGKVLTHGVLLHLVWGAEYRNEVDYVRVFIRRLRMKLEPDPEHPRYILTEARSGYRLDPDPKIQSLSKE